MATPNQVGAMIATIKARTGLPWADVAQLIGTTPTYARKLASGAGKFGAADAGKGLRSNLSDFLHTGTQQAPVQRHQRVRTTGGGSAPAAPRTAPTGDGFSVSRSVFTGEGRDGWAVNVIVPEHAGKTGDREDGRIAIMDATRRAAQGRRRVMFRVRVKDGRNIEIGARGAYLASRALDGMRAEGNDPLAWLAMQVEGNRATGTSNGEFEPRDIVAVEVIALP